MSIKHALDEEIRDELDNLSKETIGSEEYKANVEGVTKLLDRKIELEKLEMESKDRSESRHAEMEIKMQQIKAESKDRYWKHGITLTTFMITLAAYSAAFVASMNFEKEGTLTTEGGRSSLRNLLRLK